METKEHGKVRRLTDVQDTGYMGFGFGGNHLYVVCLVDCFDPPRYMVRADSWEDAYETAIEVLVDSVKESELADYGIVGGWEALATHVERTGDLPDGLTYSASGRVIDSDYDIRVSQYR